MSHLDSEETPSDKESSYADAIQSSLASDYFMFDNTATSFPEITLNESTVPVGTAKPICAHLDWISKSKSKMTDRYFSVTELPTCKGASD